MSDSKNIDTEEQMFLMMERIKEFAPIHNTYKGDLVLLMEMFALNADDLKKCQSYYRSIIILFFAIIEADIFYYNQFDAYEKYSDRHSFKQKFESTFVKICLTWKREKLQQDYFDENLDTIHKLRAIRNNLAHPKGISHVYKSSLEDITELTAAFTNYNNFINDLMSDFMFEMKFSSLEEMQKVMENLTKNLIPVKGENSIYKTH